ncbi:MAG: ABC transporter ATP-binding protein [Lachnospiraceae bacterium]
MKVSLLCYMRKYWLRYVIAYACMFISIGLDMLAPQITRLMIDDVILAGTITLLPKLLIGYLIIGGGRAIFQYIKETTSDILGIKIGCDIRRDLFKHIESLSMDFYAKNNTGEIMSRMKDDIDKVWQIAGYVGLLLAECFIHTAFVLFCMFQISVKLTLIPILLMPILLVIASKMEKKLGAIYDDLSEVTVSLNSVAQENLAGVRTVKAFAREGYELEQFKMENAKNCALNIKLAKCLAFFKPLIMIASKMLLFVIILAGGMLVIEGEISLGDLGAFSEYALNIIWPMELVGDLCNNFASSLTSWKKIKNIFHEKALIEDGNIEDISVKGNLRFDHVSLELDGQSILNDISFEVKAGNTLGIMGMTGAGKTSIINVLERFCDATDGNIFIDEYNIKDLSLSTLRKQLALVFQDVFLFSDTIKDNIAIGQKHSIDKQHLTKATHLAQASEFVDKLEDGYDTIIGEQGVGLSGGQKQRLSIARAFVNNAPILILDDASSALDMETEHALQESVATFNGVTKLIVAHRISSVCYADEILVLEEGCIVERGSHTQLLALRGRYYETYAAQYEHLE